MKPKLTKEQLFNAATQAAVSAVLASLDAATEVITGERPSLLPEGGDKTWPPYVMAEAAIELMDREAEIEFAKGMAVSMARRILSHAGVTPEKFVELVNEADAMERPH